PVHVVVAFLRRNRRQETNGLAPLAGARAREPLEDREIIARAVLHRLERLEGAGPVLRAKPRQPYEPTPAVAFRAGDARGIELLEHFERAARIAIFENLGDLAQPGGAREVAQGEAKLVHFLLGGDPILETPGQTAHDRVLIDRFLERRLVRELERALDTKVEETDPAIVELVRERGERRIRPVGSLVLADEPHRRGEVAVVREAARIASETADRLRAPFERLFLLDLREEALDGGIAVAMLLAKRSRDRRHTPREGIRHARVPIDEIADVRANFVAVRGVRDADRELVGL